VELLRQGGDKLITIAVKRVNSIIAITSSIHQNRRRAPMFVGKYGVVWVTRHMKSTIKIEPLI
jgi:hypothetical protein